MKIQMCSDLHLEFAGNSAWLEDNPLIPNAEILIIAGDTYHLDKDYSKLAFIDRVSSEYERVYLIPGNHEYYGGFDVATALEPTYTLIKKNVFMVNNQCIEIDGVNFIFSTMWSLIQQHVLAVMRGMMDFRAINYKGDPFTINHFNEIHTAAFDFISEAVKSKGKKVVVTHHLPSLACNVKEFKGSMLNEAFCVDKTNFILENDIDYWLYGHSHRNIGDFKIGNTKMVTNQMGYIAYGEHRTFDRGKTVELLRP